MSDKDRLPIKFFAHRDVDEQRVEGGPRSENPRWVLSDEDLLKRASALTDDFNKFEETIKKKAETNSVVPFVFKAKLCDDATAKSRRKEVVNLFQTRERNNVIGMSYSDELVVRVGSLDEMKTISSRLRERDHNKNAISCLEYFVAYEPYLLLESEAESYKAKLLDFNNYELNTSIQRLFENLLIDRNIKYKRVEYADNLVIYSLSNVERASLDSLKSADVFDAVFAIEPMPKYSVSLDFSLEGSAIPISEPDIGRSYATVGILDSGIARIPQLIPWLHKEKYSPYPEESIDSSHGTFVSGIVAYGDVCQGSEWTGVDGVRLFDATVFPDITKEGIKEDELIENIKEAISRNHEKIKIWNLSVSITNPVSDIGFSDFAISIDALQDKYNVLILKSAGNCSNFLQGHPKGRIHEGADSVRSLVVGSLAHERDQNDLSDADNPSPFSRIGPGPEFIIKPEISHYGGNAGIDKNGALCTTGVKSFSKAGSLSTSIGTSFSTPRVASLAAGIYQELNEEFDPLLLKALIVHSSSYSENLKIPNEERTKQLGFGKPAKVRDIIYNSPNEATLILRDKLVRGEIIDIMDFPMPECLVRDGFFTGQVIATLVYDPILDSTQGAEYCQSNIDIKFGSFDSKEDRDVTKRNILNPVGRQGGKNLLHGSLYSKKRMNANKNEFALRERLQIRYGDKYYPVKKYAVDLSELTDANKIQYLPPDKQWYMYLQGLYRDHIERKSDVDQIELGQEFCLIITMRDPSGRQPVYDQVS